MQSKITPRANEVKAVVEILESDQYADEKAMAKAIVTALWGELGKREQFVYGARMGGLSLLWGPFTSDNDAEKFAKFLGATGDQHAIFKLHSASEAIEKSLDNDVPLSTECAWCGHPKPLHEHGKKAGCAYKKCKCVEFRKEAA